MQALTMPISVKLRAIFIVRQLIRPKEESAARSMVMIVRAKPCSIACCSTPVKSANRDGDFRWISPIFHSNFAAPPRKTSIPQWGYCYRGCWGRGWGSAPRCSGCSRPSRKSTHARHRQTPSFCYAWGTDTRFPFIFKLKGNINLNHHCPLGKNIGKG